MNAAGYYHGLPGEQGDPLEASMVPGARLYGNYRSHICCMYTVRQSDIVNDCVQIPMRMIWEFGCADGWIGIVRYDSFARLADSSVADGGSIYAQGAISYGVPRPKLIDEILQGIPHKLLTKTPKYAYQREHRVIGSQSAEYYLNPDAKHPGCKIEEYGHAELDLVSSLTGFSWKLPVSSLEKTQDGLMLKLPQHA